MYLKRVKLRNFKSFAGATEIPFQPGFTGVAGPNGMGKSNISDAILFVLGPTSSKALRAERLTHLFFNGGSSKKAATECEVSLVFDNSDKLLPVDSAEVEVTRYVKLAPSDADGYYSYFYVNGKRTTQGEIDSILSHGRLSGDGYNLVQQGDVNKVVTMGPVPRRGLLERLAGISQYDEELARADAKRTDLDSNLERIQTLLGEIKNHLAALESQRLQAIQYKEFQQDKRKTEARLARAGHRIAEQELATCQKQVQAARAEIERLQTQRDQLTQRDQELVRGIDGVDQEIAETGGAAAVKFKEELDAKKIAYARLHRNRVPVLAIAAHIPSEEIGSKYFQETHPQSLFKECSHYVELISNPGHVPRIVETAIREAVTKRGVAVIVISGDTALHEAGPRSPSASLIPRLPAIVPCASDVNALAEFLNSGDKITLFCGAGCAGAHDSVVALASKLKAPIVHALRGKEHVEWENPFDVGMTGLIGFSSGYYAMLACDRLLLLGTDFPYRQFYPQEARIAQVDIRGENLGNRCRLDLGVIGDVRETVPRLLEKLKEKTESRHLQTALAHYKKARSELDSLAVATPGRRPIHPQTVTRVISEVASEDAIITCDVGEPTVWAARYLRMNGKRRLIGSFLHGSMANAMPQAIGAQLSSPGRQVISMSGDGGFAMLMGDVLTLRQLKLPVKIVIFNNGLLGFVDIEMKAAGFLPTGTGLDNPNFAEMAKAIGIYGVRIEDPGELESAMQSAFAHKGPAVIDVVTDRTELVMPPKVTLEQAKGFSVWMMKAVLNGQGNELVELARSAWER